MAGIRQWGSSAPKSVSNQNIEITQLFPIGMGQTVKAFTTIYDTTKSKDYNGGIGADVTSYDNKGLTMVLDVSEMKSPPNVSNFLFGTRYIQWGSFGPVDNESFIILPISATPIQVVVVDMAMNGIPLCMSTSGYAVGKFKVVGVRVDQSLSQLWGHWIAVCN